MGILNSGIFGGFRKKTGPVVGRRSKGKNVITSLHHISTKPATAKQLEVQDRFSLLNSFLGSISPLIRTGFKTYAKKNSAVNAAFKFNYKHAFVLQGDNWALNFPALVYSRGHVSGPQGAKVLLLNEPGTGYVLDFSWELQPQSEYCRFTDKVSVLAYSPSVQQSFFRISLAERSDQGCQLTLPADFDGQELHYYMNFSSDDGKQPGNSHYLGLSVLG